MVLVDGGRGSKDSGLLGPFSGGRRGWSRLLVVGSDGSVKGFVLMLLYSGCCCFVKIGCGFRVGRKGMEVLGIDLAEEGGSMLERNGGARRYMGGDLLAASLNQKGKNICFARIGDIRLVFAYLRRKEEEYNRREFGVKMDWKGFGEQERKPGASAKSLFLWLYFRTAIQHWREVRCHVFYMHRSFW